MTKLNGVHTGVRQGHLARILRVLSDHGALSRAELAELTGVSRVSLAGLCAELLDGGAIIVISPDEAADRGRGRPPERLCLNPRSGTLLGVEFGHRRIHVAVVNAAHQVVADGMIRHNEDLLWDARVGAAFDLIASLSAEAHVNLGHLVGVGIGVVGPVARAGVPPTAPDEKLVLAETTIEAVRSAFVERFGTTVLIDNNARLAALAEAGWGVGSSTSDLLYVRLSEGVGGGLVVDGRLLSGSHGLAGHIGHVTVSPDGELCRCGKRGCLETVVSVPNLIRMCSEADPSIESLSDITRALSQGNTRVRDHLVAAGAVLGAVLATLAVGLNPSEIVIAGELMEQDRTVFEAAQATFLSQIPPSSGYVPNIRPGRLGDGDGALGAIIAAFRQSPLLDQ